jgi:predicted nucleic acid-binding protein
VVPSVVDECTAGGPITVPDPRQVGWCRVLETFSRAPQPFLDQLDLGERHTIEAALAIQADWVLMDERLGRNVAEHLGLKVTGTLGVLLKAKQVGLISSFVACAREMRQRGIYFNTRLLAKLAVQVEEIWS